MTKRRFCLLLALLLIISTLFTGCWGARELNALSLVLGIGIDKRVSDPSKVFMTAQIVKPEALKRTSQESSGSQAKAYWNLESSGSTIFDAIREYTHETNNKLYNAHNEIILFGKDAAQDGVQKYLDFFQRAQETRPTTEIAVSMTTAAEALDVMPEMDKLPAVNITKLTKAQEFTAHSREVQLQEFTNNLLSKTKCAVAPLVWVTQDKGETLIAVKGLAVFKRDRMIGQFDENEARGLLWTENRVKTGSLSLDYEQGMVSLEIKGEKAQTAAQVEGDKAKFTLNIKVESTMVSQTCAKNLETPEDLFALEQLESEMIRQEILHAIDRAKQLNADVFGFGEAFHKYHPDEWQKLEGSWDQLFPNLDVEVNVTSKIRSAGNIIRPDEPQ